MGMPIPPPECKTEDHVTPGGTIYRLTYLKGQRSPIPSIIVPKKWETVGQPTAKCLWCRYPVDPTKRCENCGGHA